MALESSRVHERYSELAKAAVEATGLDIASAAREIGWKRERLSGLINNREDAATLKGAWSFYTKFRARWPNIELPAPLVRIYSAEQSDWIALGEQLDEFGKLTKVLTKVRAIVERESARMEAARDTEEVYGQLDELVLQGDLGRSDPPDKNRNGE